MSKSAGGRHAVLKEIEEHLEAESTQNLGALLEGMTGDCFNYVVCDPYQRSYVGPEQVTIRYQNLWRALPDLRVVLRRLVAIDGNLVVTENQLSGTHAGSLFGVPGTGKPITVDTTVIWEFRGGMIKGETVYFDLATMLRQIGYLRLPGGGPKGDQPASRHASP